MPDLDRMLWELRGEEHLVRCVMRTCCAGAELQIWVIAAAAHEPPRAQRPRGLRPPDSVEAQGDCLLRELYPSKSDLYERARNLETEYRHVLIAGARLA